MAENKTILAIVCSGTGFTSRAIKFVEEKVGPDDYDLLAVPGAVLSLAIAGRHQKVFREATGMWAQFLVTKHNLSRIVVVDHVPCAWFTELSETDQAFADRSPREMLHEAVQFLKIVAPRATVEVWFGSKQGEEVKFAEVK